MALPAANWSVQSAMVCGECGIEFSVPEHFYTERRETGKSWYCPNGHCRVYRQTEVARLQQALKDAEQARDWQQARADSLAKQVAAQKAVTTRLQHRIAAGVCPCCQRTVSQLARHMRTKHPDYLPPTSA